MVERGGPLAGGASTKTRLLGPRFWYLVSAVSFFALGVTLTVARILEDTLPALPADVSAGLLIWGSFVIYLVQAARLHSFPRLLPFVTLFTSLLAFMLVTLVVHPEYETTMFDLDFSGNIWVALMSPFAGVIGFLMVVASPSPSFTFRALKIAAYLVFAGNVVRFVEAGVRGYWIQTDSTGREFEAAYDLGFGYSVLFTVVMFLFLAFRGVRPLVHIAGAVGGVLMILVGGSRAPFLFALMAAALFLVYFRKRIFGRSPAGLARLVVSFAALGVLSLMGASLTARAELLLDRWGVSSRTLTRLIEGSFAEDSARERLHSMSETLVSESGFFGAGLFGDRHMLRSSYRWGYPHNILDEFRVTFGDFLGIILLVAVVYFVGVAIIRMADTPYGDLVVLLLPLTFQLWVSYSYLLSPWFWALLGAAYTANRASRRLRRTRRSSPVSPSARTYASSDQCVNQAGCALVRESSHT